MAAKVPCEGANLTFLKDGVLNRTNFPDSWRVKRGRDLVAKPKVFISSTCYDLGIVRSELRHFINGFGFEPLMSDHSDILYDPKQHTHDSCIAEVSSSDLLVLIIGSRLGGKALPSARALVNLEDVEGENSENKISKLKDRLSITQLETLRAVELGVPIYAFVQSDVLRDHHLYEKNKSKTHIIKEIEFPSIEKIDTAEYIFEFIKLHQESGE